MKNRGFTFGSERMWKKSSTEIERIKSKTAGFTIFVAVIVVGTISLVAAGVINLAVRHLVIANAGEASQHAFYAADSGMECALYWDVRNPSGLSAFSTTTPTSPITCNGQNIAVSPVVNGGTGFGTTTITFNLAPDPYCVSVIIAKWYVGTTLRTKIESKGYNTCSVSNPRRVERAVRATY